MGSLIVLEAILLRKKKVSNENYKRLRGMTMEISNEKRKIAMKIIKG